MGGCLVATNPCGIPLPDPSAPMEERNIRTVRDFIDRVWNYRWTREENERGGEAKMGEDTAYVPPTVEKALGELRDPKTVRHRRDADGRPIRSADDYTWCVNTVHHLVPDLKITVLDVVADDDRVVASIRLEGTDRPLDGRTDGEGAFGSRPPTGEPFSVEAAMMYRLSGGRIVEDWLLYSGRPTRGKPLGAN